MKNLRIRTKIILSFGAIMLFCCLFALIAIACNLSAINSLLERADMAAAIYTLSFAVKLLAVLAVLALITAIVLARYLANSISGPLEFFAGAIAGIAETGNIFLDDAAYKQTKVLNKRNDEIGKTSRSLGDMLAMFREKIYSLEAVAKGDLSNSITQRSAKDSIGTALDKMVRSLNSMFRGIQSSSAQVAAVSHQLAEGAQELADGSGEQATAIELLSGNISTIAQQTSQNAQMAREAASLAESIKVLAEKGGEQMGELIDAVRQINSSSAEISKVMRVIDDISFQTNILALNAAVEAARAGQHGKGFAVVAEEVRNLAGKSTEAASNTASMIEDSINKAHVGMKIAEETAASLNEIVQGVNKSFQLVGDIAGSSDEQATAIAQINTSVEQVTNVVQRNNITAAKSADASKQVNEQSALLQESVEQFKLKEGGDTQLRLPQASR